MLTQKNFAGHTPAVFPLLCALAAIAVPGAGKLQAQSAAHTAVPLFLTATNATKNSLAVINTRTQEVDYVSTGGTGGASGNAGGVAVSGALAAVVNFGSSNVTIFERKGNSMQPLQMVKTAAEPRSVAFGYDHLVVLTGTDIESFPIYGDMVGANDGTVNLERGDGTAAQVVIYAGGAIYSETSGDITEVSFATSAAPGVSGPNVPVPLPPAPNNNTPFGMVARGPYVYATIAHSDLETLIANGQIVSMAQGQTPFMNGGNITHAPCWNTLAGQFLFAADSPGQQVTRFLVSDANVFLDKTTVAQLSGAPTDLFAAGSLLAVIDGGNGTTSDASVFNMDAEGELTLSFAVKIAGAINGAAIIE